MLHVSDIVGFLTELAPLSLAEKWDNVGLLVGDGAQEVRRIMTCLTLTPDVAREAIRHKADLVVSHHPVLFKGVQKLTTADPQGKMLLELIGARVAVFSAHTAFDSARDGINQQLAELLGLTDIGVFKPATGETKYQIVCMVPGAQLQLVQEAAWKAGAGQIGEYGECSFYQDGTGTFRGSMNSHPTLGVPGRLEYSHEIRVEFPCTASCLTQVVTAIIQAHPYEEPAYFVYPLKSDAMRSRYKCDTPDTTPLTTPLRPYELPVGAQGLPQALASDARHRSAMAVGSGRYGHLAPATTLEEFLELVKSRLDAPRLQFTGDLKQPVTKVGLCCGSGGELLGDALRVGCDAFVTGEARFHTLLEARTAGVAMILAGHYATERPAMDGLARNLHTRFSELEVWASLDEQDPLNWT